MSRIFNEINTRSDFVIVLAMDGGIPSCDFDGRVISGYTQYPFGRKNSEYTHCMERVPLHEEGTTANQELLILCDRHGLASGTVTVEIAWHIPDPLFPDGYRDEMRRYDPHIRLSATATGDVDMVRVEAQLPLYKGDKGDKGDKLTYADLTVEDKEDLIGPIKDDIDKAMTEKADKTELSNIMGVPSDGNIEDLDPAFITTALRKTAQVLTPEEQAQVKANLGISKMELFIDLYNAAFTLKYGRIQKYGEYDPDNAPDTDHTFRAYDIYMTYKEACDVLAAGADTGDGIPYKYFNNTAIRTVVPYRGNYINGVAGINAFSDCYNLESVFTFPHIGANAFYNCRKLARIVSVIKSVKGYYAFSHCSNLQHVKFALDASTTNFTLADSPLLTYDTVASIANNSATRTNMLTIPVHPDVYAKLTDETNTEWYALMTEAADKNIIFATV